MISKISELSTLKTIDKIIIFFFLLVSVHPALESVGYIYYSVCIIAVFRALVIIIRKHKITAYFEKWLILFLLILFLASIIGIDFYNSMDLYKTCLLRLIVMWYVFCIVKSETDIYVIFEYYILANIMMILYILINVPFSELIFSKLGSDNLGIEWNSNSIGFTLMLANILCIYFYSISKLKEKKWFTFLMIINSIFLFLTQSKSCIISYILSIIIYLHLNNKKNIVYILRNIIIILLGGYLIYNIPYIQNNIVPHFTVLVDTILKNNRSDTSSFVRLMMIKYGFNWFKDRPFTGYGISNYSILFAKTPYNYYGEGGAYSHNNYIELLVGTGIIGFVLYYAIYISILKKLSNIQNKLSYIFMAILVVFLCSDVAKVTYYSVHNLLFITLAAKLVILKKKNFVHKINFS